MLLSNDRFLEWSKLKAFSDNKISMTQELKFALGRLENIEGEGENAGNQHFLLFPQCFYPIKENLNNFGHFELSSVNTVSLDKAIILSSCKG